MLKNIIRGEYKTTVSYELLFMTNDNSGFGFPCDERGNVKQLKPEAENNLTYCREHPEDFKVYGEVFAVRNHWREPDKGTCICGETVTIENQYCGACQCPKCGRWYNLFGQSIKSPEFWEEDMESDEY